MWNALLIPLCWLATVWFHRTITCGAFKKHASIVAVVWHRGLLGMFLKQRLAVSDYATHPFDFHKLFTLQEMWQWLLSCAKAFTYVLCLRNAVPVIAIILNKASPQGYTRLVLFTFLLLSASCLSFGSNMQGTFKYKKRRIIQWILTSIKPWPKLRVPFYLFCIAVPLFLHSHGETTAFLF